MNNFKFTSVNKFKRPRIPKGFILHKTDSDFSDYVHENIKKELEKNKIQSVRRVNVKYAYGELPEVVGYTRDLRATSVGYCELYVHAVISRNIYLIEKMAGVDAVEIIKQQWGQIKLSINWKE